MAKQRIDLRKEVFSKAQYVKTIDTSFNELGVTSIGEDLLAQPSVEEFFNQYNELFYDIPPNGEVNSHEYLVKTSGEYINFEDNSLEIEALRAEIATLRADNLSLQMENLKIAVSGSASPELQDKLSKLQLELEGAQNTLATSAEQLSQDVGDLAPKELQEDTSNVTGIGYF
tara:strand:- start:216 stop:731 length:516 start_codon:yes stop_codon:yes gene_type:complete